MKRRRKSTFTFDSYSASRVELHPGTNHVAALVPRRITIDQDGKVVKEEASQLPALRQVDPKRAPELRDGWVYADGENEP